MELKNTPKAPQRGITLVELTIAVAIAGTAFLVIAQVGKHMSGMTQSLVVNLDAESSRRSLKLALNTLSKRTVQLPIFLDGTMATELGLGAQIGWSVGFAGIALNSLPGFGGGVVTAPGHLLTPGGPVIDSSGNFDLVALIAHKKEVNTFTTAASVTLNSNHLGTTVVPLTQPPQQITLGDIVAVYGPAGVELFRVVNKQLVPPRITLQTRYNLPVGATLPISQLLENTSVMVIEVCYIAKSGTDLVQIWRVKAGPTYEPYLSYPIRQLTSIKTQTLPAASQGAPNSGWANAGAVTFLPGQSDLALRFFWMRVSPNVSSPAAPGASSLPDVFLRQQL
jgi:hypothetical protein